MRMKRGSLTDLPCDVLERIESFLEEDIGGWRLAVRCDPWTCARLRRRACAMLRRNGWKRPKRDTCAHCRRPCLTQIAWGDRRVSWVPYCAIHAAPELLADADLYCLGWTIHAD